jgi:hypothetical protein
MLKKFIGLFVVLMISYNVFAMVDTASGAYFQSWIDYTGRDLDLKVQFERTYNSRSNHKGWFGFGWCTDFETSLSVRENEITLNHCGDGKEIHFSKAGSVFKPVEEINGKFEKENSSLVRTFKDGTKEIYSMDGKHKIKVRCRGEMIQLQQTRLMEQQHHNNQLKKLNQF